MRVLLPIIFHSLTECIERAFQEEGHETLVVNWRPAFAAHKSVDDLVINSARKFKPDLAFCQFQHHGVITPRLPKQLKEIGCFTVNWSGDVRHPLPQWYVEAAPHFSVTSFTNGTDNDAIRALGYRAEFLQIGYDERIYNTNGAEDRSGVVFIGNNLGNYAYAETSVRRNMVAALREAFGQVFQVYGTSWQQFGGRFVPEPGDAEILKRALVAVGWDHFRRPGFASDRLTRATACGCAVVNQRYEGIREEHPHVIDIDSVDEMVAEVGKLLADKDRALRLGELNATNTIAKHRWNERVKLIETWMR